MYKRQELRNIKCNEGKEYIKESLKRGIFNQAARNSKRNLMEVRPGATKPK